MGSHSRTDHQGVDLLDDVFQVSGTVKGTEFRTPTSHPAFAAQLLHNWLADDPTAGPSLSWRVHPDAGSALFTARLREGLAGERDRVSHFFLVHPGHSVGPTLTSACGTPFSWSDLEFATDLGTPIGQPCLYCFVSVGQVEPRRAIIAPPRGGEQRQDWSGWDDYYRALDWPVIEHDGQLLLDVRASTTVAVISLQRDLGDEVQKVLTESGSQPPVLILPTMPDELLFIVVATTVPAPIPAGVRVITNAVPLYPSQTDAGAVAWHTAPDDVIDIQRCQDIQLWSVINTLRSQRKAITS